MGSEDKAEQSKGRPCRLTNGRSKRTCELTSSIVPSSGRRFSSSSRLGTMDEKGLNVSRPSLIANCTGQIITSGLHVFGVCPYAAPHEGAGARFTGTLQFTSRILEGLGVCGGLVEPRRRRLHGNPKHQANNLIASLSAGCRNT